MKPHEAVPTERSREETTRTFAKRIVFREHEKCYCRFTMTTDDDSPSLRRSSRKRRSAHTVYDEAAEALSSAKKVEKKQRKA